MSSTYSKSELIRQNTVFKSLERLISYNTKTFNDFLHLFLNDLVKQTGSSKGYIFRVFEKNQSFELIEINVYSDDQQFINENTKVYELSKAGTWIQAFNQKKPFVQNCESILFPLNEDNGKYEVARRFCSFPVSTGNSLNAVLVIADKEVDYGVNDLEFLELLVSPVCNIAGNFRKLEELTIAKENAEKNEQRKISYLNNISHEIKTPVNAIAGFAQLLKDVRTSDNWQKFLDIILESSNELVAIINNVSEISNIESGLTRISEDEVLLSDIFNELLDQFRDETFRKNLILQTDLDVSGEEMKILIDKARLLQILSALLSNALKFTFTGKIVFGYKLRDGFLEFFVSDTGIGIPQEGIDNVFDHFFQAGGSIVRSFKGTGLGLTMSKALVEKMGGKIWCDSVEGKGSIFHFSVPYKRAKISLVSDIQAVNNEKPNNIKKIILVAEDDNINFMLIQNFLSALDIVLLRAKNGKEAVDICSSNNVDLVLMDIRMPVMNGFIASNIIWESNPDLIIIAQTAYSNDRETALEKGFTDFIAKPFGKNQFINLVNSYLTRAQKI
jgi:signal transduction histidine kinase/CheY-like chemotaxis protein